MSTSLSRSITSEGDRGDATTKVTFTAALRLSSASSASSLVAALFRYLGLSSSSCSVVVTSYNVAQNTTQFYFEGTGAARAAATLLNMTSDQLAELFGIEALTSSSVFQFNSSDDTFNISDAKQRVMYATIASFIANAAAVGLLLVLKHIVAPASGHQRSNHDLNIKGTGIIPPFGSSDVIPSPSADLISMNPIIPSLFASDPATSLGMRHVDLDSFV